MQVTVNVYNVIMQFVQTSRTETLKRHLKWIRSGCLSATEVDIRGELCMCFPEDQFLFKS
jgi:hypothetical protein